MRRQRGESRCFRLCRVGAAVVFYACQADPGFGGRSSRDWIAALEDSSVAVRIGATDALRSILRVRPNSPEVVRALIGALGDTVDAVRMSAGYALTSAGVRAEGAVPALHNALHDTAHAAVRWQAAMILGSLGPSAGQTSVPVLTEALSDRDPQVRAAAAEALGNIGQVAAPALPKLYILLRDIDADVRRKAVEALPNISSDTSMIGLLIGALSDPTPEVRRSAVTALGALGMPTDRVIGALAHALTDSWAAVRAAAALALAQIGPPARASRTALLVARRDSNSQVRRVAEDALRRIAGDTTGLSSDPHGRRGVQ
jgi:HEAT repeat protein